MPSSMQRSMAPLLAVVAVGAASLLFAPAAEACMTYDCSSCCSGCSSCFCDSGSGYCECNVTIQGAVVDRSSVEVIFNTPRSVSVVLPTYSTTHLQPATTCVTALSPVSGVASVDAVINFDGRTGLPFEEVSFYRSHGPDGAIAQLAAEQGVIDRPDRPWYAFQSHITGSVRDGVPNYFVVNLTLEPGVTKRRFLKALRQEGLFLTSSSDAEGIPTPHHNTFRRLGANEIVVTDLGREKPERPTSPRRP